MADRKILASNLRQMAAWCKSGEDDDGSGTFIPAYPSGDVYDILTEAARELDATAAPVVVGEDAAREVIEAAQPFLADPNPQLGGGYLMNILVQASATRRLKAAIKSLTAALAGD